MIKDRLLKPSENKSFLAKLFLAQSFSTDFEKNSMDTNIMEKKNSFKVT